MTVRLSVNIDHVATVRQARGVGYPDPVEAARIALAAGAAGITAHLRVDRRHIQDGDLPRLRAAVAATPRADGTAAKLNVEMSVAPEMIAIALAVSPDQVTLVPERPEEVTTEGGLDLATQGERVATVAARLAAAGIAVSVFVDPDLHQLAALAALRAGGTPISGCELNTDAYTRAEGSGGSDTELATLHAAAARVRESGIELYAGHGLTAANVGPVAALPGMEELNIGHSLVSRAVMVGIAAAVEEMLAAIARAS